MMPAIKLKDKSEAKSIFRRKSFEQALLATRETKFSLKKDLGLFELLIFGIGSTIGAGIFVLVGVAAATKAGPAITLSFVLDGILCGMVALAYAEFAAMVPVAGSAYTYAYATLGELIAFIIGWDLILELTVGVSAVSIGWSGYLNSTLQEVFGLTLPAAISHPPGEGGIINLPGILLVVAIITLLIRGVRLTARTNGILVSIVIGVLLLVIIVGSDHISSTNWQSFFPFGATGIIAGAAVVFFAFLGFDTLAAMAEEARKPQKNMPIAIIGSLSVTTVLYVAVSAVITGVVIYSALDSSAPVANAFKSLGHPIIGTLVFIGALVALTNAAVIIMLALTRLVFAMARDRLFPRELAVTHHKFGTPHRITLLLGGVVILLTGFTPITVAAELVNIGALVAFIVVSGGVIVLRYIDPDRPRPFRAPLVPFLPVVAIIVACVLLSTLQGISWIRFLVWLVVGLFVYFLYSRKRSLVSS